MSETFNAWKARTMSRLGAIIRNVSDPEARKHVNNLIVKLGELRARDISGWIRDLILIANAYPEIAQELLALIPSEEDIEFWLRK
ncbi:MAG: hypothetical protein QXU87_03945 [Candidatus Caldarchaeum sp.]